MIRLAHTSAALRRILGSGLATAWLRHSILRSAEKAAAEDIGSLAVFARVVTEFHDRLDDQQLAGISEALAVDLPLTLVLEGAEREASIVGMDIGRDEDGGLAMAVRTAFEEPEGVA